MNERLTERERQILELAAQHLTSKQIGPRLGIRPTSVDTFMQAIIRKLGVASRKEAVIAYLAAREGQNGGRDDLDFGLSTMASPVAPGSDGLVARHEGASALSPLDAEIRHGAAARRYGLWRRALGSRGGRLIAIAVAAMVLGLATLGAVAVGYGLNQALDRWLGDHVVHPRVAKAPEP